MLWQAGINFCCLFITQLKFQTTFNFNLSISLCYIGLVVTILSEYRCFEQSESFFGCASRNVTRKTSTFVIIGTLARKEIKLGFKWRSRSSVAQDLARCRGRLARRPFSLPTLCVFFHSSSLLLVGLSRVAFVVNQLKFSNYIAHSLLNLIPYIYFIL